MFDPVLTQNNTVEPHQYAVRRFDPLDPTRSLITSTPTDAYRSDLRLTKTNVLGGQWGLDWTENPTRFAAPGGLPLNPQNTTSRGPQLHATAASGGRLGSTWPRS